MLWASIRIQGASVTTYYNAVLALPYYTTDVKKLKYSPICPLDGGISTFPEILVLSPQSRLESADLQYETNF